MMELITGLSANLYPWHKVVCPFLVFMLTCDNLHTFHCKFTENYFVVPRLRSFPRLEFNWLKHLNAEGLELFSMLYIHDPGPTAEDFYEVLASMYLL